MSSQFTTEIGRMRSEEMIARGLRYQEVEAARRAQDGSSHRLNSPRSALLRGPILAALGMLTLFILSFGMLG